MSLKWAELKILHNVFTIKCKNSVKKVVQLFQGLYSQKVKATLTRQAYSWLLKHKKKGFYTLVENDSFEEGGLLNSNF